MTELSFRYEPRDYDNFAQFLYRNSGRPSTPISRIRHPLAGLVSLVTSVITFIEAYNNRRYGDWIVGLIFAAILLCSAFVIWLEAVSAAVEMTAREHYGRLLAYWSLARVTLPEPRTPSATPSCALSKPGRARACPIDRPRGC